MSFSRRRFLRGLGGVAVGLPMFSLFEQRARAQTMPSDPKRAVFFWTPNGFNMSTFYPRTRFAGGSSAFGPLGTEAFAARPLDTTSTDTIDGVSRALFRHPEWGLRNLGAFGSRLNVLRGFRNSRQGFIDLADGGDHAMNTACRLTAAGIGAGRSLALGRSIDYAIAERINPTIDGAKLPLVLHVGSNSDPRNGNGTSFVSYKGPEDPDPGINNPWVAFRRLMGIAGGSTAEDYLVKRKKRTADLIKAELGDLSASFSFGSKDRGLLTQWLGLIESTEDTMHSGGMCTPATINSTLPQASISRFTNSSNDALGSYSDYQVIGDAMIKIIALSFLCGHTNVATLMWSFGAGGPAFGPMGLDSAHAGAGTWHPGERHHELSHRNGSDGSDPGFLPDVERNMSWIDQWYGDRYRDLLALLDSFSLLDDSVVVWMPEFGDGRQHHFIDITAVVAGSAGGYLKTGAHVDCSATGQWSSRLDVETNGPKIKANSNPANVYDLDIGWIDGCTSHNKLLTTVFNAVLPRMNGAPVNPIARFPEQDTADPHNMLESGEVAAIKA
ncbi:MAG: DUF1552 domain-containing protein [Myxococcota bacterium]